MFCHGLLPPPPPMTMICHVFCIPRYMVDHVLSWIAAPPPPMTMICHVFCIPRYMVDHVIPWFILWKQNTVDHVIPCYTMLYHVIPCYTMLYHVIPCYTMLMLNQKTWLTMFCHGLLEYTSGISEDLISILMREPNRTQSN